MKNHDEVDKAICKLDKPDSPITKEEPQGTLETTNATCTYGGQDYKPGDTVCMGGKKYKCTSSGQWFNTNFNC